jgi:dimethylhistidine N-methyltransferase
MSPHSAYYDLSPAADRFREDLLEGLRLPRKCTPPKYFYDDVGSALFDAICGLSEYYPTRTETALMQAQAGELAACLGRRSALIEFGSGMSRKTRILLDAARPAVYMPIDISGETLRSAATALAQAFPDLPVVAVCADYSTSLQLPSLERFRVARTAVFFPGSTIGNFDPEEAVAFLGRVAQLVGANGGLVIGVDLRKDPAILEAAYDDAQGVTAAFNLNVLARANRELGADFDLRAFRHRALYSQARGRVEMHLESLRAQTVHIGGQAIAFAAGESIHTESSYKYSVQEFQALAACAGFRPRRCWVDERALFSIHYMEC